MKTSSVCAAFAVVCVAAALSAFGAAIYYTLDGSTPTTSSTLYSGPIVITNTTMVKALAIKSGYARSDVFTRTFVSAAAIDEYYFRHDFSGGTRVFTAGDGSGLTRDQVTSTDSNAKAVAGPDGPATAHHADAHDGIECRVQAHGHGIPHDHRVAFGYDED